MITLRNIGKVAQPDEQGAARVIAERIPDSGEEVVSKLEVVFDENVKLDEDGALKVSLGGLPVHQALIVSVLAVR